MASAIPIRASARRSSSARFSSPPTLSRLPSSVESPRTLCPQDTNAFAFNPGFLKEWTMDDELWKKLPASILKVVIPLQHAGAAVLTSLERLEKLDKKLPEEIAGTTTLQDATASDAIAAKLHEHQARSSGRTRSSTKDQEEYNCSPVPLEWRRLNSFSSSQTVDSSSGTNSTGYASPSAHMSPPSLMSPVSPEDSFVPAMPPFDLGQSRLPTISYSDSEIGPSKSVITRRDSDFFNATRSSSSRHDSHSVKKEMPRDPASIRYYAELEHLRKIALVRLRHSTRPVDVEWCVVKHEPPFTASKDDATHKQLKNRFEQWWMEKKQQVAKLDEQGKELCTGVYFSLGWSDTPGMDHTEIVM